MLDPCDTLVLDLMNQMVPNPNLGLFQKKLLQKLMQNYCKLQKHYSRNTVSN